MGFFGNFIDGAKKAISAAVNTGKTIVKKAVDTGKKVIHYTINTGKKVVKKTYNTAKTIARKTAGAAKTVARKAVSAAKTVVNKVVDIGKKVVNGAKKVAKKVMGNPITGALLGGAAGAIAGGLIAGPVGAVAGGTAGAALGSGIGMFNQVKEAQEKAKENMNNMLNYNMPNNGFMGNTYLPGVPITPGYYYPGADIFGFAAQDQAIADSIYNGYAQYGITPEGVYKTYDQYMADFNKAMASMQGGNIDLSAFQSGNLPGSANFQQLLPDGFDISSMNIDFKVPEGMGDFKMPDGLDFSSFKPSGIELQMLASIPMPGNTGLFTSPIGNLNTSNFKIGDFKMNNSWLPSGGMLGNINPMTPVYTSSAMINSLIGSMSLYNNPFTEEGNRYMYGIGGYGVGWGI
ncbi:MAG: hypothetical protein J7M18_03055 [Candidatus Eremiobacteraeota bacterium]|nr:hypothetical protein [Candidatus Eremiobacteraeota bacterium]